MESGGDQKTFLIKEGATMRLPAPYLIALGAASFKLIADRIGSGDPRDAQRVAAASDFEFALSLNTGRSRRIAEVHGGRDAARPRLKGAFS